MAPTETFSMIQSQALACVRAAPHLTTEEKRQRRRFLTVAPAQPKDAMPAGLCLRCGFQGQHLTADACIDALRSEIAQLEFRLDKPYKPRAKRQANPDPAPEQPLSAPPQTSDVASSL